MATTKRKSTFTSESFQKRLHMVQGQIDGILKMYEDGADCVALLIQFKAARAGLEKVLSLYLEENLRSCMSVQDLSKRERAEVIIRNLIA